MKRQAEKTYAELLNEAQDAGAKVAKVYVRQLAEALKREDYPKIDLEQSPVEEVMQMCKEIKTKIYYDCTWWAHSTIQNSLPEWIEDQYYADLARAKHEKDRMNAATKIVAREQKSISEDKKEFNLLSSVIHQVDIPKVEEKQG